MPITIESTARVGVRLLAIWVLVTLVAQLPQLASTETHGQSGVVIATIVGAAGTYVGAAVALWLLAPWLSRRIAADGASSTFVRANEAVFAACQVAVGIVGVFVLSSALPECVWVMGAIVASKLMGPSPLAGQPEYDAQLGLYAVGGVANAASILVRLGIGVVLLTKARFVSALILSDETEVPPGRPTMQ